jgi:uncharacterized membrane protein
MSLRAVRLGAAAAALAGAGVTAYLLSARWGAGELVCRTGGCETVQSSGYAEILGIPVAALGLATYAAIAFLVLVASPKALAAAVSLALAACLFSAYLLVVQVAVIGELCDWCLVNDALVSVVAALVMVTAWWSATGSAATPATRGTTRFAGEPPRLRAVGAGKAPRD